MLTRGRVATLVVLLILGAVAYTAWLLYAAQRDLRAAEADARALRAAIEAGDVGLARQHLEDLQESAGAARNDTDGPWWGLMTLAPSMGDDLEGIEALSVSLDELASGAGPELIGLEDSVDGLMSNGRVDLAGVQEVGARVRAAEESVGTAYDEVARLDSSDYVGLFRDPFDEYVDVVGDLDRTLGAARTATEVAPTMLGADGPRDYLLVFQNNAEARSTGGLPGAWARLHVEDGALELREQGSAGDFAVPRRPVVPVTEEEDQVYGDIIGRYFQDPLMVPDFPRAAEIFDGFWRTEHPDVELDGVLTMDTVALSYALRATGPIEVEGFPLTPDNAVQALLNEVYLQVDDPAQQDALFADAAATIFATATTRPISALDLVESVDQAVDERRLMLASFDGYVSSRLAGTRIAGGFGDPDAAGPHVGVTVNDATGSKLSYYLDTETTVRATSCSGGVQQLEGSMTLRQTIPASEARDLPPYLTGGGLFGVPPGSQQLLVRLYAPYGGELGDVVLDGAKQPRFTVHEIGGRQSITLVVALDGTRDVDLTWAMTSAPGQAGDGVYEGTPEVTPGPNGAAIPTAC